MGYHQGCAGYRRVEEEFAKNWRNITNNPFSRALPYQPTKQEEGHLRFYRGNPPGIGGVKWTKTYNLAYSELYKEFSRRNERPVAARKNGRTRDRALTRLIKGELIEADFVDSCTPDYFIMLLWRIRGVGIKQSRYFGETTTQEFKCVTRFPLGQVFII